MKLILSCNFCGSESQIKLFTVSVQNNKADIVQCKNCRLVFLNPQFKPDEIEGFYRDEYFKDHIKPEVLRSLEESGFHLFKKLEKYLPKPGKVLDFGAAIGSHLYSFRRFGWDVSGVEISEYVRKKAKEIYNIELFPNLEAAGFPENNFDLIVMNQVIEHVLDPVGLMKKISGILKPGGILFVSTPNFGCRQAQKMRAQWPSLHPGEHLFFFSPDTLTALIGKCGLKIVGIETSQPLVTTPQLKKLFGQNRSIGISDFANRFFPNIKEIIRSLIGKVFPGEGIEVVVKKD